ncbi:MAG: hypothetical protein Q9227_001583 [Pyrenula ochraceoflavens]
MPEIPTNPLHLLRAILRECTYLPDQQARTYIHNHALAGYRKNKDSLTLGRRTQLLRTGRKSLSILRRANEGYIKPLDKVLLTTYGRIGKRRRQLMSKLMTPQSQEDAAAVSTLEPTPKYQKGWKPPQVITDLIRSQNTRSDHLRAVVKARASRNLPDAPKIPSKNIWGRPMPLRRVRNITQKWYATVTDSLFPPLPDHEWHALRALAVGKSFWPGVIPRRKMVPSSTAPENPQVLDANTLLDGPPKGETFEKFVDGRPHTITAKFMRKRWAVIFQHSPLMWWDEEKGRWKFKWGSIERRPIFQVASPTEAALFFPESDSESTKSQNESELLS